ncbi:MAG: IreB family regulatory phosphoprotein [Clostridia bacterium]|nr:IreB family regulatory phosphoprotein [Clostridia bacterium]
MEFNETMKFNIGFDKEQEVKEIMSHVYEALKVKGYDPISQIVGYILSGDPTYITSYNGARGMIVKVERDELLEELVKHYIKMLEA